MILCLETSTKICSVALCDRNGVVALKEDREDKSHASRLTVMIGELLSEAGIKASALEAVAVSKGPGSYTGLRIGTSTAKGISYAAALPLIAIETTLLMYHGIGDDIRGKYGIGETSLLVPMLDARRMEAYYSIFNSHGAVVKEIAAEVIDEDSFGDIPEDIKILLFGDGSSKCRNVIKRKNTEYAEEFLISAAYMLNPALEALKTKHFEDVAYFEPFYLKDFITSRPKKNILGR